MTRFMIALGIGVGMLVGAAVPAVATILLAVVPIVAAVLAVSWVWEQTGWPVWALGLAAAAGIYAAVISGSVAWYGRAAGLAFEVAAAGELATVGPLWWIEWVGLTAPLAIAAGLALALPLLVRESSVRRALAWVRPRWGDEPEDQDRHLQAVK